MDIISKPAIEEVEDIVFTFLGGLTDAMTLRAASDDTFEETPNTIRVWKGDEYIEIQRRNLLWFSRRKRTIELTPAKPPEAKHEKPLSASEPLDYSIFGIKTPHPAL